MNLGEELKQTDAEKAAINTVVRVSEDLLDKTARPIVPRDQHPKQHGCVRAKFIIEPNLASIENGRYCVGLFRDAGKSYDAWIRFSNGGSKDDTKPDAHGMAIKLMGVEGEKIL